MFQLITNANVYAPQSLGIANLLICAGKIVYLGQQVPQLDDCLPVQTTDLNGLRLIPGFIDA
ncbi:MAG: beta-aspartyl-peptidase, partial [Gammaproteobacteria bacterium]|nr:beta-aspartyl-peptidase [Gammaproteobacteria bacterium]